MLRTTRHGIRRCYRWTQHTGHSGWWTSSIRPHVVPQQRWDAHRMHPVSLSTASGTSTQAAAAAAAESERRRQSAAPQSKSIGLHADLHDYLVSVGVRSSPEMSALHATTCELGPVARNVSPPDTVSLLQMLMRLVKAERVLEIGVFTGFTALGMALALPAHGRLVACELEEKWTRIGRPYWRAAGVSDQIELRIGTATETLACMCTPCNSFSHQTSATRLACITDCSDSF